MLGWDGERESLSTGTQDPVSKPVDVGDVTGLCNGDLGGINVREGEPGDVRKKLGDRSGTSELSGVDGLLLERGVMIPPEFFRMRPRETPRAGINDVAFDHNETKRLERCALPRVVSPSSLFMSVLELSKAKVRHRKCMQDKYSRSRLVVGSAFSLAVRLRNKNRGTYRQ